MIHEAAKMNPVNVAEQPQVSVLEKSARAAALKRLEAVRGTVIVGDILAPLAEEWTGDADNV